VHRDRAGQWPVQLRYGVEPTPGAAPPPRASAPETGRPSAGSRSAPSTRNPTGRWCLGCPPKRVRTERELRGLAPYLGFLFRCARDPKLSTHWVACASARQVFMRCIATALNESCAVLLTEAVYLLDILCSSTSEISQKVLRSDISRLFTQHGSRCRESYASIVTVGYRRSSRTSCRVGNAVGAPSMCTAPCHPQRSPAAYPARSGVESAHGASRVAAAPALSQHSAARSPAGICLARCGTGSAPARSAPGARHPR
jgi:hypothetical protein